MLPTLREKTAKLASRLARALPHFCVLCHNTSPSNLCDTCRNRYFTDNRPRCRGCAHPLPESPNDALLCGTCLKAPPPFDRIIAAADYMPPVDQLVQSFKFGGNLALAPLFARLLEQAMQKHYPENQPLPDCLLPVPLAEKRLTTRGFNQALEIARPLSRLLGIPILPNGVYRIRETVPQTTITLKERHKNMQKAFAINDAFREKIQGRHIAIVDDVLTTGETMGELARILKQAGAAHISGLIFARTPI